MNVMKLYSTKFDEYVALSKEEAALKKKPRDGKATEEAKEGDGEESLEATLKKLKFIELEREIVNLRSIVALVVPKLNELDLLTVIKSSFACNQMIFCVLDQTKNEGNRETFDKH